MAVTILKRLLEEYVQSLFDEGIVDERFSRIQRFINLGQQPDRVVQLIDAYLNDVEISLSQLSAHIEGVGIDSSEMMLMSRLVHTIEDRSSCIGARHVRLACIHLIQAVNQGDHKIISQAVSWIKHEFSVTRKKLEPVVQMERRIIRLIAKQQN